MANSPLSILDIRALLERYQSDLRLLDFQSAQIRKSIQDLEKQLAGEGSTETKPAKAPKGPKATKIREQKVEEPKARKAEKKEPADIAKVTAEEFQDPTLQGEIIVEHHPQPKNKEKKGAATKEIATKGLKKNKSKNGEAAGDKPKLKRGRTASLIIWDQVILEALEKIQQLLNSKELLEFYKAYRDKENLAEGDTVLRQRLNQSLVKLNKMNLLAKAEKDGRGFDYGLAKWVRGGNFPKKYQKSSSEA